MKKWLKKWLGIADLSSNVYEEQLKQIAENIRLGKLIAELADQVQELDKEARRAYGVVGGLIKYLNVELYTDLEQDPHFLPPQPRMREVVRVKSAKRAK